MSMKLDWKRLGLIALGIGVVFCSFATASGAEVLTVERFRELKKLRTEAEDEGSGRKAAREKLSAEVNKDLKLLVRTLVKGTALQRELAATVLMYAAEGSATDPLAKALSDSDEGVRVAAARSMKSHLDANALSALIKALEDKADRVREHAALRISELAKKDRVSASKAAQPLVKTLGDKSWKVRLHAVQALMRIKDPKTRGALAKLLDDENAYVRFVTRQALEALRALSEKKRRPGARQAPRENPLEKIYKEMAAVKGKLDRERIGESTIVAQENIDKILEKLIKAIEQQQGRSGKGKGKGKKKGKGKGQKQGKGPGNSGGKGKQGGKPGSPMQDSHTTSGAVQHGAKGAVVKGRGDDWSRLPPKVRASLTTEQWDAYPERYKSLLSLYYKNLAEEEE